MSKPEEGKALTPSCPLHFTVGVVLSSNCKGIDYFGKSAVIGTTGHSTEQRRRPLFDVGCVGVKSSVISILNQSLNIGVVEGHLPEGRDRLIPVLLHTFYQRGFIARNG